MPNIVTGTVKELSAGTSTTAIVEIAVHGTHAILIVLVVVGFATVFAVKIIENKYEKTRQCSVRNYGLIRVL